MRKTIGLGLIALALALALLWHGLRDSTTSSSTAREKSPEAAPAVASRHAPALPSPQAQASPADPALPGMPPSNGNAAYPVDLQELRRRIPENLYWTLGAPTEDARVLEQRRERARQTNELYGKVLSNTATVEEVDRYYAERRRVSEDYIAFAQLLLADYRSELPDEHVGLYELSIKLHRARLAEIPRDREEALGRLRQRR
jgi:hypothetical protein